MREVKKIPLSKLLKLETRGLVENVVEILKRHDVEALHLQDFNIILLDQFNKVKTLVDSYGKHPYTEDIALLHEKRLRYASIIVMQVDSLGKKDCLETQRMATIAKRITKEYFTKLRRKSVFNVSSQIWMFFEVLKREAKIEEREALVGLGLQHCLDDLENANKEYEELYTLRRKDIKERPSIGGIHVEMEAQKILRLFFEQVNSFQKIFEDIDYSPLIRELNVELTKHSKNIKTRVATNKRRARKRALAKEVAAAKDDKKGTKSEVKIVQKDESHSIEGAMDILRNWDKKNRRE